MIDGWGIGEYDCFKDETSKALEKQLQHIEEEERDKRRDEDRKLHHDKLRKKITQRGRVPCR